MYYKHTFHYHCTLIGYIYICSYFPSNIKHIVRKLYVGVDGQNVTIVTNPAGVPVDGQNNTFDYPILTKVILMCMTTADGSPANVTSYRWDAINCYNDSHDVNNSCFYGRGQTNQIITGNNLRAEDAGTVSCTATIDGTDYTSDPLTLRISGELDIYTFK